MITAILNWVEMLIFLALAVFVMYLFVFAFAGLFYRRFLPTEVDKQHRIAILIPGYKEDAVIVETAKNALLQDYPRDAYEVIVIADSFQPQTLETLRKLPITVIEVSFDVSTKAKALNVAMAKLSGIYDIVIVLDADNTMEESFCKKINASFSQGFMAIQGHRVAKNQNTPFAILDAISEEINNFIFRQGHRALGLSSALIGSGMAFQYSYFKEAMNAAQAIGGFDKELELKLLKERKKIDYLPHALVYDEKVEKSEVFERQRRRWLSAQFVYFRKHFLSGLSHLLLKGNIDYFDKVFQMVQPPRVLLLGVVTVIFILELMFGALGYGSRQFPELTNWFALWVLVFLIFLFSTPRKFYNFNTLKALFSLPKAFFIMFLSLFKLKGANRRFIHTAHTGAK
jgi:cellulose synthase/poly-beta-1,6-N-acetylglucosamine synthase-like glycosyltransferase